MLIRNCGVCFIVKEQDNICYLKLNLQTKNTSAILKNFKCAKIYFNILTEFFAKRDKDTNVQKKEMLDAF